MSVTEECLANSGACARGSTGQLPLPPSEHVAVVECVDAYRGLGLKEDVTKHESLRGFVFEVAIGKLNEVTP
ncbi:hypothetical protein BRW65_12925 [Mycobacterium paraffinicum]|uniref:Uncharacterized protein n=1 Tax=Mycobacterium paraffinicum TaxID=53378 RepID=A0A1Q4HV09_9MYCO|nr:hypothetical protein [Mycobacterium paraffinicum]OJZ73530.1 hypothetical protein BRW65_12925 [Mycobacterium paraffinicum]